MSHANLIVDADPHFSIDPITRRIKNESSKKVTLIQGDHNSERFTFELPRFIEEHDMLECDRVEVHFVNGDNASLYLVKDMQIHPEDETKVAFSWLVSDESTQNVGRLEFQIRFCCTNEDGVDDYIWNTAKNTDISISDGMNNAESVVERYPAFLETLRNEIKADLMAHKNNENAEASHIRQKWAAAIEILFEALSTSAENTKNTISPGGFAVGYNNNVNKCSLAVGLLNVINGYRSFGAGQGLNSYGESNRAYVGQFNAKNGQAVFVVGWGSSDSDRKNVFTVDKVGNGVFAGDVKANGQKLASENYVNEKQNENVNSLLERMETLESTIAEQVEFIDIQQGIIAALEERVKKLEDEVFAVLH